MTSPIDEDEQKIDQPFWLLTGHTAAGKVATTG